MPPTLHTLNLKTPPRLRRWCALTAWLGVAAGLLAHSALSAPAPEGPGEYELKAALVAKLPSFVTWPADAAQPGTNGTNAIVIGVLGRDPFGPHLRNASQRVVAAGGHRVSVRACAALAEARQCHLVFIATSEKGRLAEVLAGLRADHVLTVSDLDGFGEAGGMVRLASTDRRVTLQINLAEARAAGLRIDPQLLQLAKAVATTPARK